MEPRSPQPSLAGSKECRQRHRAPGPTAPCCLELCGYRKVYSDQDSGLKERWKLKTEEPAQVWDQVQECSRWGCWGPGRARVGRPAQPEPTPRLAPSPAHTLSRGLRSTGSEIPTAGSSLSSTAHLFSERNLQGRTLERNSSQGAHNW